MKPKNCKGEEEGKEYEQRIASGKRSDKSKGDGGRHGSHRHSTRKEKGEGKDDGGDREPPQVKGEEYAEGSRHRLSPAEPEERRTYVPEDRRRTDGVGIRRSGRKRSEEEDGQIPLPHIAQRGQEGGEESPATIGVGRSDVSAPALPNIGATQNLYPKVGKRDPPEKVGSDESDE